MTHDRHCRQLLAQLCDYMDNELEPGLCVELEAHLDECDDCSAALESLRKTVALYRRSAPDELPADVRARLDAALCLEPPCEPPHGPAEPETPKP